MRSVITCKSLLSYLIPVFSSSLLADTRLQLVRCVLRNAECRLRERIVALWNCLFTCVVKSPSADNPNPLTNADANPIPKPVAVRTSAPSR